MSSSVNDLDEFRLIHSQIQRGLHDLQAGLKKLKSPSDTPDETILPPTPSGDSRALTPVKLRQRHLSTSGKISPAKIRRRSRRHTIHGKGESDIVTEINHLVQRVDRMIRSNDSVGTIESNAIAEIDDFVDDDGESVRSNRTLRQSSSISSLDSYMTCWDEFDYSVYQFLHVGMQHAEQGLVDCRKVHRYQMFNQRTKTEYLAKLYCLRRVDRVWLADGAVRDWLREMTLNVLKGLLRVDQMDTTPLEEHFDTLLDWSWRHPEKLRDELREQGVADLSLFDVIIDWCLLDAVDFQANLPASIGSILANRWVDDNYKRTGMTSEVWSFIKKKRALLLVSDCFMTRFYDLCQALVPSLAWGTLGPSSPYSELCRSFKAELLTLCTEIFASSDAWKSQRLLERRYSSLISKTFSRLFTALSDVTGDSYHFVDVPLVARRTYSESSTSTINDEIGF